MAPDADTAAITRNTRIRDFMMDSLLSVAARVRGRGARRSGSRTASTLTRIVQRMAAAVIDRMRHLWAMNLPQLKR
jgi:hypothetical protein